MTDTTTTIRNIPNQLRDKGYVGHDEISYHLCNNNKKTEALWIGSYTGPTDQLCPEKNLKWVKDKTKSLGVWISTNPTISINENYREKLERIRSCLNCWEYRRLTLLEKLLCLKA